MPVETKPSHTLALCVMANTAENVTKIIIMLHHKILLKQYQE
jgi:hypothetical protein